MSAYFSFLLSSSLHLGPKEKQQINKDKVQDLREDAPKEKSNAGPAVTFYLFFVAGRCLKGLQKD